LLILSYRCPSAQDLTTREIRISDRFPRNERNERQRETHRMMHEPSEQLTRSTPGSSVQSVPSQLPHLSIFDCERQRTTRRKNERTREQENERVSLNSVDSTSQMKTYHRINALVTGRANETTCRLSRRALRFGESDLIATLTSSSRGNRGCLTADVVGRVAVATQDRRKQVFLSLEESRRRLLSERAKLSNSPRCASGIHGNENFGTA